MASILEFLAENLMGIETVREVDLEVGAVRVKGTIKTTRLPKK